MSKRRQRLQGQLGAFVQQYARKKNQNDPNDRRYDRGIERLVKQMDPYDLDDLLHGENEENGEPRDA
jgi:hypothetical protein